MDADQFTHSMLRMTMAFMSRKTKYIGFSLGPGFVLRALLRMTKSKVVCEGSGLTMGSVLAHCFGSEAMSS